MPVTFARIAAQKLPLAIETEGGETLNIEYYPQRITSKLMAKVSGANRPLVGPDGGQATEEQVLERLDMSIDILTQVMASWDMVESMAEDGTPGPMTPIDYDHLSLLGVDFLWSLVADIFAAAQMGKQKRT